MSLNNHNAIIALRKFRKLNSNELSDSFALRPARQIAAMHYLSMMEQDIQHFIGEPNHDHAPEYARYYFQRATGFADLITALKDSTAKVAAFMRGLPEDKKFYRYADDKWSTLEVLAHINDTERVFQYRALRLARKDPKEMEGFEENYFVRHANEDNRTYEDLAREFEGIRHSTLHLFSYMTADMLDFVGSANGSPLSARSAGWLTVGHSLHHMGIVQQRYLVVDDEGM